MNKPKSDTLKAYDAFYTASLNDYRSKAIKCRFCDRVYTDQINRENILDCGMCLLCEDLVSDHQAQMRAECREEQE